MTERRAALVIVVASAVVGAAGMAWPARFGVDKYHLGVLAAMIALFAFVRGAPRPFGMPARLMSAALVVLPAVRGGMFIHQIWIALVWFGLLEFGCAVIRRQWMDGYRHELVRRRLERQNTESMISLEEMKNQFDRVQEEITLFQTVYDLATRQTVGMARVDILAAAGQSLKELARRRDLQLNAMWLCLASGEDIDLRNPRAAASMEDASRGRAVKEKVLRPRAAPEGAEPSGVIREGAWIALPVRYQNRLLGGLCLEIEGWLVTIPLSPPDVKLLAVTADLLGLAVQNSVLYEQVNQMAITDRLTGLYVLWYFKDRLKDEVHRSMRSGRPLTLLMMDLDHFKQVNDTYGHLAGDTVLRDVAGRIKSVLRDGDLVARYGGEEISAILPETAASDAARVAERIRGAVGKTPVKLETTALAVTISIGVNDLSQTVQSDDPSLTADRLIKSADEALYCAKHAGRNCVRVFRPQGNPEAHPAAAVPAGRS
ncbi:MAG: hypothetical protein A3G34_09135 [Candidatus Lindowbacteria bacterium RIFCSPLOWO2_12_FULL_62_27]|nr:MAG: hypothetical protein A3I06_03695 [Candidatus Lindowbacteria bacterium RIFCSPLOWO2_02_FULL_62_12]OGH60152.1 MAG: hypothetical protein A3G34_09135 [Candidatus Lindowbacteria bacterium RIFCSPLOWO2_12_FULL_62_27]